MTQTQDIFERDTYQVYGNEVLMWEGPADDETQARTLYAQHMGYASYLELLLFLADPMAGEDDLTKLEEKIQAADAEITVQKVEADNG